MTYRPCEFSGCTNKHYGKGWCTGHYQQWAKGGPMNPLESVALSYRNDDGEKRCPGCRSWLREDQFGLNAAMPDGLAGRCKSCAWSSGLWSKYRIRGEDYVRMLADQGGGCAVCGLGCPAGGRLAVDHDHACCPGVRSCGRCVRGLLCVECNTSIGSFKDDVSLLRKAITYLERR